MASGDFSRPASRSPFRQLRDGSSTRVGQRTYSRIREEEDDEASEVASEASYDAPEESPTARYQAKVVWCLYHPTHLKTQGDREIADEAEREEPHAEADTPGPAYSYLEYSMWMNRKLSGSLPHNASLKALEHDWSQGLTGAAEAAFTDDLFVSEQNSAISWEDQFLSIEEKLTEYTNGWIRQAPFKLRGSRWPGSPPLDVDTDLQVTAHRLDDKEAYQEFLKTLESQKYSELSGNTADGREKRVFTFRGSFVVGLPVALTAAGALCSIM